jgi:hypothetical protein
MTAFDWHIEPAGFTKAGQYAVGEASNRAPLRHLDEIHDSHAAIRALSVLESGKRVKLIKVLQWIAGISHRPLRSLKRAP